jgi:hypothetical protein
MVDELEELDSHEREVLKRSIDQIAADTPMTEVAVIRFKRLCRNSSRRAQAQFADW